MQLPHWPLQLVHLELDNLFQLSTVQHQSVSLNHILDWLLLVTAQATRCLPFLSTRVISFSKQTCLALWTIIFDICTLKKPSDSTILAMVKMSGIHDHDFFKVC